VKTDASGSPDDGETATATATHPEIDEDAMEVLEDLRAVDVNETAPVELLTKVREWQRRVD
jgi:hypothetical protein